MNPARVALFCAALVFLPVGATAQVTIHVPADHSTIQAAIAAASHGDTIVVAPGTYVENINFLGKAITVKSSGGAAVTIIDGNQNGPVVSFITAEGAGSVLQGFTIRNGNATFNSPSFGQGGGISINGASPIVEDNIITQNQACTGLGIGASSSAPTIRRNAISNNVQSGCGGGVGGGGILLLGGIGAQIIQNRISGNTIGSDGGGISLWGALGTIVRDNVISQNTASAAGGGIYMVNGPDPLIVNNLITGNSSFSGGGIYWLVPSGSRGPKLLNNTIADNSATQGSAILADGFDKDTLLVNNILSAPQGQTPLYCGDFNDLNPPILRFNNVFGLGAPAYGGFCSNQTGSNGNISSDPLFVGPATQNYRLQAGSASIDAASSDADLPASDLDAVSRIVDGNNDTVAAVDMGAYEFSFTTATVSPSSLTFAAQQLFTTSAAQSITINNAGTSALQITITLASSDFSQTNNCATSSGVPAGGACTIDVVFNPTTRGLLNATITIVSNTTSSPHLISLSGTGQGAVINLSATSLTFPDTLFGSTSPGQSVTLTNVGDTPLTMGAISVSSDFGVSDNCGVSVAVNASCQVTVTFSPTARGTRVGAVTITSDAEGTPHSISLSGNGLAAHVNLSTSSLTFGATLVGSASSALPVVLTNQGDVALSIAGILANTDFSATHNCGAMLAVNASCTIDVTFAPTARGVRSGVLTLTHGAPGSPHLVTLQGFGFGPVVTLTASSISFGNQVVGTSSTQRSVALRNTGDGALSISSIVSSGDFTHFTTCSATLNPNSFCVIIATFTPSTTGPLSGDVTITHSAAGSPHVIALSGTGVLVGLSATSVNFGNQLVGVTSNPVGIQYSNVSGTSVNIAGIVVTGDFSTNHNCGAVLPAGANCTINVTFIPQGTGARNGTLTVTDDALGSPRTVTLFGSGVVPNVSLSRHSVAFNSVLVGTSSAAGSVNLTNNGAGQLLLTIAISGDFTQTNTCGTALAPAATCTIDVRFAPQSVGVAAGTLSIMSNAPGSPHTVALSGDGVTSLPLPGIASLAPSAAARGSGGFTLTVTGGNFFPNSVVRWNGIDQPTTYVNSTSLTAAIPAANVANLGAVSVTVFTPAPGGGISNPSAFAVFATIDLTAKDLLYDPFTRKIFATVPSTAPANGNALVPIDPFMLALGTPVFVGSEPGKLAASDDGQFLYIGLDGSGEIRKFDIPSQTSLMKFGLGSDPTFGAYFPEDIEVLPGNPNAIAVSLRRPGVSPRHGGVAIFDDGVRRPNKTPDHTGSNVIAFSSSSTALYGCNNETSEFGFRRMVVNSSGVTVQDVSGQLCSGPDLEFDGGRIYTNSGLVIDPSVPTAVGIMVVGNQGFPRAVRPISSIGRTFLVGQTDFGTPGSVSILAFDQGTFTQVAAVIIPVTGSNQVGSLVRWGSDGLAFRAGSQVVLLRTSLLTPSTGNNPAPVLTGLTPNHIAHGALNTVLSVSGTGFVPGSVVLWNSAERTTTYLSATQLRVAIPAADLATPGPALVTVMSPSPGGGTSAPFTFTVTNMVGISLAPATLSFGNQRVSTVSAPQTLTLSNSGNFAVPIAGIATSGDFTQTNNCGSSLAAGASCTVTVTFAPTASGGLTGALNIAHYTFGISSVSALAGTGVAPALSPVGNLTFSNQQVGTTSSSQTISITNTGNASLSISSVTITGDFGQTNSCNVAIAPGASCTITVTFAPTAAGTRTGSITITHDAAANPTMANLSGTGFDFTIVIPSGGSASQTITAGGTATFNLNLNAQGLTGTVNLTCQLPANLNSATCSINPAQVQLTGTNTVQVQVSITTTRRSLVPLLEKPRLRPVPLVILTWMLAAALAIWALRAKRPAALATGALALCLLATVATSGCGGGASVTPALPPPPPAQGTNPGTYNVTVNATSGNTTRPINLSLTVN